MQHSYQQQHFSLLRAVCSGCCVPYLCCSYRWRKGEASSHRTAIVITPWRFSRWQVPVSTWWERGTASLHHTAWVFHWYCPKSCKAKSSAESVIYLYGDNVVSIPLLHGKWQDEENWRFSEPFAFASREKILRCWIMIMYVIWGVKKEKEVNFGSFSLGSFPFKATVLICFVFVCFINFMHYMWL